MQIIKLLGLIGFLFFYSCTHKTTLTVQNEDTDILIPPDYQTVEDENFEFVSVPSFDYDSLDFNFDESLLKKEEITETVATLKLPTCKNTKKCRANKKIQQFVRSTVMETWRVCRKEKKSAAFSVVQNICETNAGTSTLCKSGKNYGGIKVGTVWITDGKHTFKLWDKVTKKDPGKIRSKYSELSMKNGKLKGSLQKWLTDNHYTIDLNKTINESGYKSLVSGIINLDDDHPFDCFWKFKNHESFEKLRTQLFEKPRYRHIKWSKNVNQIAQGVKDAGYATDESYVKHIIAINNLLGGMEGLDHCCSEEEVKNFLKQKGIE